MRFRITPRGSTQARIYKADSRDKAALKFAQRHHKQDGAVAVVFTCANNAVLGVYHPCNATGQVVGQPFHVASIGAQQQT